MGKIDVEEVRGSWLATGQGCSSRLEEEAHGQAWPWQQRQQLDGPAARPPLLQLQHWCGHLLSKLSPALHHHHHPPPQQQQQLKSQPQPLLHPASGPRRAPTFNLDNKPKFPSTRMALSNSSTQPSNLELELQTPPSSQQQQQLHPPTLPFLHLLGSFSPWSHNPPPAPPTATDTPMQPWTPLSLLRPFPFPFASPSFPAAPPSFLPLAVLTQSPAAAAAWAGAPAPALALLPPPSPSSYGSANAKAELGRATWTLLHTLAAQLPERPSRQQQRDTRQLVELLTRIYPCGDCARHFTEIVKRDPPVVSSGREFQAWMCRVHNTVNRSLGKPAFNCGFVTSRWSPMDCGEGADAAAPSACAMSIGTRR